MEAARSAVQAADRGFHPVHKVRPLVDVACQVHSHPGVDLLLERPWRAVLPAAALLKVVRVGFPIQAQVAKDRLAHLFKERPDDQLIDDGRLLPSAGDHGCVRVAAQDFLHFLQGGVAGMGPGLVASADVRQLLGRGGRCA